MANSLMILATTGGEQWSPFEPHRSIRPTIVCVASECRNPVSAS